MTNNRAVNSQKGFTLIELLAVMAIIAILAAIVAPAVSGTKDTGANAQAGQDALQVRTAANQYFTNQETVEVVTTNDITTLDVTLAQAAANGTAFNPSSLPSTTSTIVATQKTSSRWPEQFITSSATSTDSVYYAEIPVANGGNIGAVYFVDKVVTDPDDDGTVIGGVALLEGYSAIGVDTLVTGNYLESEPQSADATRVLDSSTTVHTLVWLFKKTSTPGTTDQQGRDVRVFKLTTATKNGNVFDLTYERIF